LHAEECIQEALIARAEALHLALLGIRGHHQSNAQHGLQQEAADLGNAFPHRAHTDGQALMKVVQGPQTDGDGSQAHQEDPQAHGGHNHRAADEKHQVREHAQQAVRGDAHVTHPGAGPEARRERLQVPLEHQTHIEQNARGDAHVLIAGDDVQQEAEPS